MKKLLVFLMLSWLALAIAAEPVLNLVKLPDNALSDCDILYRSSQVTIAGCDVVPQGSQSLFQTADYADLYLVRHKGGFTPDIPTSWGKVVYRDNDAVILYAPSLPKEEVWQSAYTAQALRPMPKIDSQRIWPAQDRANRTDIDDMIDEIASENIGSNIQSLQDFVTRYAYADNRKDVAMWIRSQYLSYGFDEENTIIDSFYWDQTWHYNVVAYIEGTQQADSYIVFGGHHDSISGVPFDDAPGADDNGSSASSVMEVARVLKQEGYEPDRTLVFCTFAAEEIGLVGSWFLSSAFAEVELNIVMMLNNDMISTNSQAPGEWELRIDQYIGYEFYANMAVDLMDDYTSLQLGSISENSSSSDSYPFYMNGFPTVYFAEQEFSPYYHSPQDIIDNCDLDYCEQVARLDLAMIVTRDKMPSDPAEVAVYDVGDGESLLVEWADATDSDFDHYEIYWGTDPDNMEQTATLDESQYTIEGLEDGVELYIGVCTVDTDGFNSLTVVVTGTPNEVPVAPTEFMATPIWDGVALDWADNQDLDLEGYNLYRAESEDGEMTLLNQSLITDTQYSDETTETVQFYWYAVAAVDEDGNESIQTERMRSRCVSMDQNILLVDDTIDGSGAPMQPTDADCDAFYNYLMQGAEFTQMEADDPIRLDDLCAYSSVVWYMDNFNSEGHAFESLEAIRNYLELGGNVLVSGFKSLSRLLDIPGYPAAFAEGDVEYDIFGVEGVQFSPQARFYRAESMLEEGYDIDVDTLKTSSAMNFHLINVEGVQPAQQVGGYYTYGTLYDTAPYNELAGEQVMLVKSADNYNFCAFTFPMFYMEAGPMRDALRSILTGFFEEDINPVSEDVPSIQAVTLHANYPNPFNPETNISFSLPSAQDATLSVYNVRGEKVCTLADGPFDPGNHTVTWHGRDSSGKQVSTGVYFYRLQSNRVNQVRKMLLLK